MRATELLMADAMPACESSTAPSTVAVSGATVSESPRPSTRSGGEDRVPVRGAGLDPTEEHHADRHHEGAEGHREDAGRSVARARRRGRRRGACTR